tara:strand:+ start:311 stop:517 length:207 start_codon:yes stop_codon:yes gene_type:complete
MDVLWKKMKSLEAESLLKAPYVPNCMNARQPTRFCNVLIVGILQHTPRKPTFTSEMASYGRLSWKNPK